MKLFLFSFSILCCFKCYCQPVNIEQTSELPVFKAIGHSFMATITSDYFYFSSDGLMWFSTAQGLSSFDGSEVVNYSTKEEAFAFGLNGIRAIAEDKYNNFYIGGDTKLSYFNRKNSTFALLSYHSKETGNSFDISAEIIFIENNGQVYIGADSKGLLIYDPSLKNFQHFNLQSEMSDCWDDENLNTVSSFAPHATDSSKLWIGSFNGVYLFDKKTKQFSKNFMVINPAVNKYQKCPTLYDVRKMDVADDSTIWFSTVSNGFAKYNTHNGLVKLFTHDGRLKTKNLWKAYTIREFAKWTTGKYILGIIDPNPGIFDTKEGNLQWINISQKEHSFDEIQYIANDREGNVWVLNKGLLYVSLPDYYSLKSTSIKCQLTHDYFANRLGDIYFDDKTLNYYAAVPFSSGVYVLNNNMQVVKSIPVPLYSNRYTFREASNEFITKDGSGRFWTTCLETYILKTGSNKFEYADKISPRLKWLKNIGEFWDVTTTREGNILLRSQNGTVYHIDHRTFNTDSFKIDHLDKESNFIIGTTKLNYDSGRHKLYINNLKSISQYDFLTHKFIPLSNDLLFGSTTGEPRSIQYAMDDQGRLFNTSKRSRQVVEYALDNDGRIWIWIPRFGVRIIDPDKLICVDSIANGTRGFIPGNFNYLRFGGKDCMFFIGLQGVVVYNYEKQQSLLFDVSNGWSRQLDYYKGYCNNYLFISGRDQIEYFNLTNFSKINFTPRPLLNTITAGPEVIFTRGAIGEETDIELPHEKSSLTFSFSASEFFFPERLEYAYELDGIKDIWHYTNSFNRRITYTQLTPGKYIFRLKAQISGGNWKAAPTNYIIIIKPALWQTLWFKFLVVALLLLAMIFILRKRINVIRRKAIRKSQHEKELMELEAKALRSQMNPHFIFNCMNSIKSLIQKNENEKATIYLTTFSKLIRTIFENSDRRDITLFDELETCKLYTQLESMRFGNKFSYNFYIDKHLDLKSVMVPALIIQPFIENAIWHGIIPRDEAGSLNVEVQQKGSIINCVIDDDGIGRDVSIQGKFRAGSLAHESKGVRLTQSRIDLSNFLNERKASVEMIDKRDKYGKATGTKVIIQLTEY